MRFISKEKFQCQMSRDVFTFDLNMITSYQLGVDSVGSAEGAMEEMVTMPSAFELRSQIAKVGSLVVLLSF